MRGLRGKSAAWHVMNMLGVGSIETRLLSWECEGAEHDARTSREESVLKPRGIDLNATTALQRSRFVRGRVNGDLGKVVICD